MVKVIKKGEIFSLENSLLALPNNKEEEIEVTKIEAIKLMAKTIKSLRDKNYSYEQIAEILTNNNFPVSSHTLKSVLIKKRKYKKREKNVEAIESTKTPKASRPIKAKSSVTLNEKTVAGFNVRTDSSDI